MRYQPIIFRKVCKFVLFSCLLFTTAIFACDQKEGRRILANYIWLTEDYPPYNFRDHQGNLQGMSVDILELIYQQLAITLKREDILLIPWARLIRNLNTSKQFAAFTMVYTKTRAEQYTLVAIPIPTTISIMVLDKHFEKLSNKPIKELSIAVVREDIGKLSLDLQGILAKQVLTTSHQSMVNMLYHGRVDAISFNEELVKFKYNANTFSKHTIKTLSVLQDQLANNYVFHKDAPKCATELFTVALDKIIENGALHRIKKHYLP